MDELSVYRAHARKMDRRLRHALLELMRPPSLLPCLFHRPVRRLRQSSLLPVIVQYTGQAAILDAASWSRTLRALGGRLRHHLPAVNGLAADVPVAALPALLGDERVARVTLDYPVRALLDVAAPAVRVDRAWEAGVTGRGVTVAIVDTGVYPHPDLVRPRNRLRAFADLVEGRRWPYDDNGHGTHCAGDAVGNGHASGGRYRGPAWEADLVGVKVLGKDGGGAASTVMAGIQWCLDHRDRYGIRVISLSLGGPASLPYREDPLCQMVERAWEAGIVCCVAAGNAGPDDRTIQSPGIDPKVITVGAMDDRRTAERADDALASFSSRGPTPEGVTKPDVVAPGVDVISLRAPNSFLDRSARAARHGDAYALLSGTSMATPIVAGVAALLLQRNPSLTPDQVKAILKETAEDRGYPPDAQGAGYVDAAAALARALTPPAPQPPAPAQAG